MNKLNPALMLKVFQRRFFPSRAATEIQEWNKAVEAKKQAKQMRKQQRRAA